MPIIENVTIIETVSANGDIISLMIILPEAIIRKNWFTRTEIPNNYYCAVSDTSYLNNMLSFQWLQHFHFHSGRQKTEV